MFFSFDFASAGAVSDVTYRFADADGNWLAAAQTDAVQIGAIDGLYGIDATPPTGAVVIYWACSDATLYGHENVEERIAQAAERTAQAAWRASDIDSYSIVQALKLILSVQTGKTTGMNTNAPVFRSANDAANRISASLDAYGNRTSVTLNV